MAPSSGLNVFGYLNTFAVSNISTTENYPQTTCQVEQFNSTISSRLRHYVLEYQMESDINHLPLMYG